MSRLFLIVSSSRSRAHRAISLVVTIAMLLPMVAPYASVSHASAPAPGIPTPSTHSIPTPLISGLSVPAGAGGIPAPGPENHSPLRDHQQAPDPKGGFGGLTVA